MTDYSAWQAEDCDHFTDVNISEKTVICKRKPVPGITITLGMFFDGTGNNVFNTDVRLLKRCTHLDVGLRKEDIALCIKNLGMSVNSSGSYMGYYSNIHWLNTLYSIDHDMRVNKSLYQRAIYIQGVGTQQKKEDSLLAMGTGKLSGGIVDKTDEGISQIAKEISTLLGESAEIPYAIEKIQFDLFGFSRGAAAARHFANRIRKNDQAIQRAIAEGLNGRNQHGKPAGEIRFIGLFDTVCAVGLNPHDAVNPGIDLDLPPDIAQHVFQIAAMHECRYNFSLNSIKEVWPELVLPGVHADIGGGYNPHEQEYYFLTKPENETVLASTPAEVTNTYSRAHSEIAKLKKIAALSPLLPNGEINVETWYDYLVTPDKKYDGTTKKRVGAAVTFKRTVSNDWSKVSLRVMLDAATDAGINMLKILPHDKNLTLPPDLETFSKKANNQGKEIRNGNIPSAFTLSETEAIGKYLHCSAHWNSVEFKDVWLDGHEIKSIYGAIKPSEVFGIINRPNTGWKRAIWNMKGQQA